jgi:hypothetical protein
LTDRDNSTLALVRHQISLLDPTTTTKGLNWMKTLSDHLCLRFIQGHGYNLDEIMKYLKLAAAWREEYKTDQLIQQWESDQSREALLLKSTWPFGIIGHDGYNRPIQLYRMVMVDFVGYQREVGMDLIIRHNCWRLEKNNQEETESAILLIDLGYNNGSIVPQCKDERPVITSFFTMRTWISGLMHYLSALTKIFDVGYPESYHKIIFLRAPVHFWATWKIAQLLIAENTRKKVIILTSNNPHDRLLEYIPEHCIPDYLNGTAPTDGIPQGGLLI